MLCAIRGYLAVLFDFDDTQNERQENRTSKTLNLQLKQLIRKTQPFSSRAESRES
jgi:hypothetical protein